MCSESFQEEQNKIIKVGLSYDFDTVTSMTALYTGITDFAVANAAFSVNIARTEDFIGSIDYMYHLQFVWIQKEGGRSSLLRKKSTRFHPKRINLVTPQEEVT